MQSCRGPVGACTMSPHLCANATNGAHAQVAQPANASFRYQPSLAAWCVSELPAPLWNLKAWTPLGDSKQLPQFANVDDFCRRVRPSGGRAAHPRFFRRGGATRRQKLRTSGIFFGVLGVLAAPRPAKSEMSFVVSRTLQLQAPHR